MAQVATTAGGWVRRRSASDASARGAYWQHVVLSRVALARNDLEQVRARKTIDDDAARGIDGLLGTAEHAARRPGSRVRLWLSGSAINRAFVNLHAAQVLLAKHLPDERIDLQLLSAMARVRTTMPPTAERREDLERRYTEATRADTADGRLKRWVLEKAMEWSYATTDAQYARLRSFRNILSGVSIAVLAFAIGLAVMGLVWPETLQLCFGSSGQVCPTGTGPSAKDALVIEVLGAAGGALAAVLAVSKMQGTSTPYSVPLALAMLKLPFGALSALLGLVLIHGRFVPGLTDLDTSGQILAYAIVLGIAQHLVTALVDRRGQELLADIPGKRAARTATQSTTPAPAPR
ncbi:MAG TPA: hypothetical protein VH502_01015 [Actinoplanes sp.]